MNEENEEIPMESVKKSRKKSSKTRSDDEETKVQYLIDQNYIYYKIILQNNLCIPQSFNTNITYLLFGYIITFMNSQHKTTNSKSDFVLKNWFEMFV